MLLNELMEIFEKHPLNAEVVVPDEGGEPSEIKSVYFDGERVWLYDHKDDG